MGRSENRLSALSKRRLRARAHHLKPVVIVGAAGISAAVVGAVEHALEDHALIKIRVNAADRKHRRALIEALCETCRADLVQTVGHVAVLFKEPQDEALRENFSDILD